MNSSKPAVLQMPYLLSQISRADTSQWSLVTTLGKNHYRIGKGSQNADGSCVTRKWHLAKWMNKISPFKLINKIY